MDPLPSGTIWLLFTDVENYTALCSADESATLRSLCIHDDLLREDFENRGGHVFKTAGDAFHVAFTSPQDALGAAIAAQQALANADWGAGAPALRVRMALHVGAPERRDGDYFGMAVNHVARVRDLGHGGQILVTPAACEILSASPPPGVTFRSLDAWRLKGMPHPETVYQVIVPSLPSEFPPLRAEAEHVGNLPDMLASFIGREEALRQVERLLESEKLVTLRGAGGCGKTRLGIEAARRLAADFPGGAWLVRLDALENPDLVATETTRTLRIYCPPGQSAEEALIARLRERPALIVLDNCEHLLAACARMVHSLLSACSGLRILATSRESLGVPGEAVREVPPLALPKGGAHPALAAIRASEAVQLFLSRASASANFTLTRQNASEVAEICIALDGIPLALELAARWVGALPLETIARELRDLVNEPSDDEAGMIPARQRTMRSAVDWSYHRLQESEQSLFLSLAAFVGGFTLEAARAVSPDSGSPTRTLRLLSGLVNRSLVLFDEHARPEPRYRLLEPVREVAVEKLLATDDEPSVRARHHDWFIAYAARAESEFRGPQQSLWLDRLDAEQENLRSALKWSIEPEVRLRLAISLHRFWLVRGHLTEGRSWLEGALAQSTHLPDAERATALNILGTLAWMQNDVATASRSYEDSLALWERLENRSEAAKVLNNLGIVARDRGAFYEAVSYYERCLDIYRSLGDDIRTCVILNNIGAALSDAGDYIAARPLLEESLRLHRLNADRSGEATALHNLAEVTLRGGSPIEAEGLYRDSLAMFHQLGEWKGIVLVCVALATLYVDTARYEAGAMLLSVAAAAAGKEDAGLAETTRKQFDLTLASIKQAISEEVFESAWLEGQVTNPIEIVTRLLTDDISSLYEKQCPTTCRLN